MSSPATSGDYGYKTRADDLQAVIASLSSKPIILVAHSGSAGVALEYAKTHAESLLGIYFLDPASDPRAIPEDMRQGFMGAIRSENGLAVVQGYFASIAGQNRPDRALDCVVVHFNAPVAQEQIQAAPIFVNVF